MILFRETKTPPPFLAKLSFIPVFPVLHVGSQEKQGTSSETKTEMRISKKVLPISFCVPALL